jgi:hypothetical protein
MYTEDPSTHFDYIKDIRGRKYNNSIQRGLNLKGMGPRFYALSKERAIE